MLPLIAKGHLIPFLALAKQIPTGHAPSSHGQLEKEDLRLRLKPGYISSHAPPICQQILGTSLSSFRTQCGSEQWEFLPHFQAPLHRRIPFERISSEGRVSGPQLAAPILFPSCLQEPVGGRLALIGSTPIWKEAESVVRTGKRPGENTLKRELWTKFEAASSNELLFNDFVTHKGFLDRLDEVS
ncbi:uncharacterized protein LOC109947807 [Prunus persica]|uniref:uncharacterized protein LOC109947807 n=1 Tax=Prunus persica TaxID=3760 RepID=UPI0009AB36A2|nr:uncharacterized protein LOC109947807 [Prunus persica]